MDKKNKILIAALELFGKNGYFNTTVESISRKSGVAKGTVYWYFKDKKELFLSAINYTLNNCNLKILDEISSVDSPELKLKKYIETFFKLMNNNYSKMKFFMINNFNSKQELINFTKNLDIKIILKRFEILSDIIEEGKKMKVFKDYNSEILTLMISGLINFEITRSIFMEKKIDKKRIDFIEENVLKILSKE